MSDTPRTDAVEVDFYNGTSCICHVPSVLARDLERELNEQVVCNGKGAEREADLLGKVDRLERENALLLDALRECLDGAAYTVSVDAILDPSTRHIGLEKLARHRSLLPDAVDVCPDSDSSLPNV